MLGSPLFIVILLVFFSAPALTLAWFLTRLSDQGVMLIAALTFLLGLQYPPIWVVGILAYIFYGFQRSFRRNSVSPAAAPDSVTTRHPILDNPPDVGGLEFIYGIAQLFNILTPYKAVVTEDIEGVDIALFKDSVLESVVVVVELPQGRVLPSTYIAAVKMVKDRVKVKTAYLVTTVSVSNETRSAAAKIGVKVIDAVRLAELRENANNRLYAKQ